MEVRFIHFIGALIILLVLLRISKQTRENFEDTPPTATFTLYYSDTCPISQKVKPDFETFAKTSPFLVGTKKIVIQMADPDKEPDKIPSGYNLYNYPSILFNGPKGVMEYTGERTIDKYKQFLNERFDPAIISSGCLGLDEPSPQGYPINSYGYFEGWCKIEGIIVNPGSYPTYYNKGVTCEVCDCVKKAYKVKYKQELLNPSMLVQCYKALPDINPTFKKDATGFYNT